MLRWLFALSCLLAYPGIASAELIVNSGAPIDLRLTVQPIIVSNSDNTNMATFMGTAAQEAAIKLNVDRIWGQAGINVHWLTPNHWNSTFANIGTVPLPGTRPASEYEQILSQGQAAGVSAPTNILSMYFIDVVPGFPVAGAPDPQSRYGGEGLATVSGPGSTIRFGDLLPGAIFMGDPLGEQFAAKLLAHEIGHNLGLLHLNEAANLMLAADPTPPEIGINARLNAGQILTVRESDQFLTAVPEPSSIAIGYLIGLVALIRQRRA